MEKIPKEKISEKKIKELISLIKECRKNKNLNSFKQLEAISNNFKIKKNFFVRIVLIDKIYSTQIDNIESELDELEKEVEKFEIYFGENNLFDIYEKENKFENTFNKLYGKRKKYNTGIKAISFLSKYFYFLSNKNFPIYDKIARESLIKLKLTDEKYSLNKLENNWKFYFNLLKDIKVSYNINFDELDNFLWFFGKLRELNFKTIINSSNIEEFFNQNKNLQEIFEDKEKKKKERKGIYEKFYNEFNLKKFEKILNILKKF